MKKSHLFIILILLTNFCYSQSSKEMLDTIEGKWDVDSNGNVTLVRIIEIPEVSKTDIYNRAVEYFIYNYGSGKSVIESKDQDSGIILAKGVYKNVHEGISLTTTYFDAWHIIKIEVKEERARVIISLTEYEKKIIGLDSKLKYTTIKVSNQYPISKNSRENIMMTKAFYKSFLKLNSSLDSIETALKEGNTSKSIENTTW